MYSPNNNSSSARTGNDKQRIHHPSATDLNHDTPSIFDKKKHDGKESSSVTPAEENKHRHKKRQTTHEDQHHKKHESTDHKLEHEHQPTKVTRASIEKADDYGSPAPRLLQDLEREAACMAAEMECKHAQDTAQRAQGTRDNIANEPSNRTSVLAQYGLAFLVISAVGWVCLFTVLSTHTQVSREHIYKELETKYFSEKAGARVFSYTVILYLLVGSLTYLALLKDIRLPKPSFAMIRSYQIPLLPDSITPLELFLVFLVVSTQIASFLARTTQRFDLQYWPTERVWYEISKNFGKMAALSLMLLLIPVSKTTFWLDLFNFQFERAIKLHRWIAWWLVLIVCAHAVTAIVSLVIAGNFKACMWPNENCHKPGGYETYLGLQTSRIVTYGWIAVLIALPLVITSIPWFRRHRFEWFFFTHFLFIPFFVMLHLHYPDLIYYMAPGLTAYVLDKVLWWCVSRRRTRMIHLTISAPGFVRVIIAMDKDYDYLPGQWVLINIPVISFLQWHPMSVSSCPGHSTMTIDIKVEGNWTEKLYSFASVFDPAIPAHTTIFVDGFYGSSHTEMQGYLSHSVVAMFGGGIGITPMMSSLRHLIEQSNTNYPHIRKVVFVWCVKKMSCLEPYRHELAQYQRLCQLPSGCELQIIVHVTLSEKEEEPKESEELVTDQTRSEFCAIRDDRVGKACPFQQYVTLDYKMKLFLTILAGCSFMFGIFLANFAAYEKEWRDEAVGALSLFLSVGCTAMAVVGAIGISYACSSRKVISPEGWERDNEEEDSNHKRSDASCEEKGSDLEVVIGKRPDPQKIFAELQRYCQENQIPSVGVSACGPRLLVDTVFKVSRDFSSPSVEFVVDEETFDW